MRRRKVRAGTAPDGDGTERRDEEDRRDDDREARESDDRSAAAEAESLERAAETAAEVSKNEPEDDGDPTAPPRVSVGWGNVITDVFRLDPHETAERLRAELRLGDDRSSYGKVLRALDRSASNLYDAIRLHRSAVLMAREYELKATARLEVLRTTAREGLVKEKAESGVKSGAITKEMIDDRCLALFGDQTIAIKRRIEETHGTARALETLVEAWQSRCADLRLMADHAAKASGR